MSKKTNKNIDLLLLCGTEYNQGNREQNSFGTCLKIYLKDKYINTKSQCLSCAQKCQYKAKINTVKETKTRAAWSHSYIRTGNLTSQINIYLSLY
uniref:Uncharacterized protein n=1 Tax=Anguilla anguilla TaxID=7936 RepID=A0A0E9X1B3_ANGAN